MQTLDTISAQRHAKAWWIYAALAGVAFYLIDSYLVGIVAAIAAPAGMSRFMSEYPQLGLAVWDLVTVIPVTIAVSVAIGAALAKMIEVRHFTVGLLAVVVAMLLMLLASALDGADVFTALRVHWLPMYWSQVSVFIATWLSLPLVTHYVGTRSSHGARDEMG